MRVTWESQESAYAPCIGRYCYVLEKNAPRLKRSDRIVRKRSMRMDIRYLWLWEEWANSINNNEPEVNIPCIYLVLSLTIVHEKE